MMKSSLLFILCIVSLYVASQRRGIRKISSADFVGTWKLTKLADKHLDYLKDSVELEIIKFTLDSIFVTTTSKHYAGTWKLVGTQAVISITDTDKFNYEWIAGDTDSKFLTRKGLGYYKYFVRINKL